MVISLVSASECRHIGGGKIDWHTKFGASVTYKKVTVLARLTGHSPLIQNVDFPAPMTNLATSSYKNTSGASSNRGSHFLLCMILYVDSSWGREKSSENSFETQCRKSPRVFLLGVVFGRRLTGG